MLNTWQGSQYASGLLSVIALKDGYMRGLICAKLIIGQHSS